jgi:polysaccharide export outer membrane protein
MIDYLDSISFTENLEKSRMIAIGRMLLTGLVAILLLGFPQAGLAQGGVDSTFGPLLEALRTLEASGSFDGSAQSEVLDRARERAQDRAESGLESRIGQALQSRLSRDEQLLIDAYCRGLLKEEQERFIETVPFFSRTEQVYCRRAGTPLFLSGYAGLGASQAEPVLTVGAAGPDYRLGIGDELVITLVGSGGFSRAFTVDREGRIVVPQLEPIGAAGLTLSEFRAELDARARRAFVGAEVFVSLGSVRSIGVFVAGEVERPGSYQLTALSTVLDILNLAGGIKKTGSLRRISVQRGTQVEWIDLYDVIYGLGAIPDLSLRDGAVVRVPYLGETIAVGGDVKRPGIFELPEGERVLPFDEAVRLAGGLVRPRGNVYAARAIQSSGRDLVTDYGDDDQFDVSSGDLVLVRRAEGQDIGVVDLTGEVTIPGVRSLDSAGTIAGLIGTGGLLKPKAYRQLAVLQTTDGATGARRFFPIDLQRILDRVEDYRLKDQDKLLVLNTDDIRYLVSPEVQVILRRAVDARDDDLRPSVPSSDGRDYEVGARPNLSTLETLVSQLEPSSGSLEAPDDRAAQARSIPAATECSSLVELRRLVADSSINRYSNASLFDPPQSRSGFRKAKACRQIYEDEAGLLPFVLEHGVAVLGEVRSPGLYPLAQTSDLGALISLAGGPTKRADLSSVEVAHFGDVTEAGRSRDLVDIRGGGDSAKVVEIGDVVRLNRTFNDLDGGTVRLVGEFLKPGTYDIRRGERLSSLIARAGGITAQAYPYGAIFTRERVRIAEEDALRRLARELNSAVTVAAANKGIDASAIQAFARLTREVAEAPATGRVVIEADPTVLQVRPELDVVLEAGDQVVMPKRPASVLVTGDVLNPGALQFIAGVSPDRYIRQAGGFQASADRNRIFVVFPNGVASPVSVSVFDYTPLKVPPGSTIVVPKDATPFDLLTLSKELASVISQLAITAASLAVISN